MHTLYVHSPVGVCERAHFLCTRMIGADGAHTPLGIESIAQFHMSNQWDARVHDVGRLDANQIAAPCRAYS
jgi:hypothetical protein